MTLPDYRDTQDILVRRGSVLASGHTGRRASRLSLGAKDLLAARLPQTRPDALVTGQPRAPIPDNRLAIDISRLDGAIQEDGAGRAILDPDWIHDWIPDWINVSRDAALPTRRGRISLEVTGAVGSDLGIVSMETMLLSRLCTMSFAAVSK